MLEVKKYTLREAKKLSQSQTASGTVARILT